MKQKLSQIKKKKKKNSIQGEVRGGGAEMKDQTSYDAEIFSLQLEEREKTASLAGRDYDVTPRTPGHATRQPKQEVLRTTWDDVPVFSRLSRR